MPTLQGAGGPRKVTIKIFVSFINTPALQVTNYYSPSRSFCSTTPAHSLPPEQILHPPTSSRGLPPPFPEPLPFFRLPKSCPCVKIHVVSLLDQSTPAVRSALASHGSLSSWTITVQGLSCLCPHFLPCEPIVSKWAADSPHVCAFPPDCEHLGAPRD